MGLAQSCGADSMSEHDASEHISDYADATAPAPAPSNPTLRRVSTMAAFGSFVARGKQHHNFERKPLIEADFVKKPPRPMQYDDLIQADQKRKIMLGLARNISPIDTVGRLSMLPRTVIPRILRHWPTWMVGFVYGCSSGLARWGRWDLTTIELDITAFDGGSSIVVFMILE